MTPTGTKNVSLCRPSKQAAQSTIWSGLGLRSSTHGLCEGLCVMLRRPQAVQKLLFLLAGDFVMGVSFLLVLQGFGLV
jgi:hypothetical protein